MNQKNSHHSEKYHNKALSNLLVQTQINKNANA